jgi:hypothetical protein
MACWNWTGSPDTQSGIRWERMGVKASCAGPRAVTAAPGPIYEMSLRERQMHTLRVGSDGAGRLHIQIVKPSAGLEPATPSLPWKCSTN